MKLRHWPRFQPGISGMIAAGSVGITVNTLVLQAAPLFHVNPGKGGLLQLLLHGIDKWLHPLTPALNMLGLRSPPSLAGFLWFHYITGLGMILLYFYFASPRLSGPQWWRATQFSLLPWLMNAGVVLPMLGQGFAGMNRLSFAGALYFFIANWIFVVVSALCYVLQ